jgi:hypothetical protein
LSLIDQNDFLVLSMRYTDSNPWPPAADGFGRTLELLQDSLNPALPASWFAGCVGGSPGRSFTPCTTEIVFSEINYQSALTADAGDWVELWNTSAAPVDISGWEFRDSDNTHQFKIPLNTVLAGSERYVLSADTALFSSRFPLVSNFAGPLGFGLSSGGEAIRLFDETGRLYQSVVYDQDLPWPTSANGGGFTLELVDENGNLCDGNNWQAGCPEGSPGKALILPCVTSGVPDISTHSSDFMVYPNPSSGLLTLQFLNESASASNAVVQVFNAMGEQVYSGTFGNLSEGVTIDLTVAAKGMYWLRLWVGDQRMEKIVLLMD